MDLVAVTKLSYLCAVTDEALRIYPPGPNAQPRITPTGGSTVLGHRLPKGVVLSVPHRAMYLSENNFSRAHEFVPERWLGAAGFENDRIDAFKPFSHGPRNCIGTNLAYAEFRLILARMIWNFDFALVEHSRNWMEQHLSCLIWQKPPLYVHLRPHDNPPDNRVPAPRGILTGHGHITRSISIPTSCIPKAVEVTGAVP